MNEELFKALGLNPEGAKEKAFTQGLLGAIFQASALSGPQTRPVGNLQGLGLSGLAGIGAYESSFDKQLKEALTGLQVKELLTKRKESEQLRTLLPQVFKTTRAPAQTIYDSEGETTIPGGVTGVSIDPSRLQALMMVPGGMEAVKGLAETQKLLRQSGLTMGAQEAPSPFAPYLSAQSPEVRKLAETYTNALKSGSIDEETAYKRIEPLAKMEDAFIARQASNLDRAEARRISAGEREEKRLQGTEGQNLSAGFASRMEAANAITDQLEGLQQEGKAQVFQTKTTATAAGVPLIGGYLQRKAMSPEQQQYKQAADNWIRANLRKESGAAIPPEEMQLEYETYFPLVGEEPAVIEQKKEARRITTQAMIRNAGPVYKPQDISSLPTIRQIRTKFKLEGAK
jgi:hypothetical protein